MKFGATNPVPRSSGAVIAGLLALALAGCGQETPPQPAPKATPPAAPEAKAPPAPAPAQPAPASADKALAERVRAALLAERGLNAHGIDVVAKDGAVTLFGTTENKMKREIAAKVAAAVTGVKSVENRLAVVAGS
ncbi:MAG: BON domain-containing protein [Betaproteobacteria bacterium]|nr:BON domain-containing protein [Betaproteobacteria bacterium]